MDAWFPKNYYCNFFKFLCVGKSFKALIEFRNIGSRVILTLKQRKENILF